MTRTSHGLFEIISDGTTCWVNGPEGGAVGRFGKGFVDVHVSVPDQEATSRACDDCGPTQNPLEGWERFKAGMKRLHDLDVSDDFAPVEVKLLLPMPEVLHPSDKKPRRGTK